jgi:hypothetical protein
MLKDSEPLCRYMYDVCMEHTKHALTARAKRAFITETCSKAVPLPPHKQQGEEQYSSYSFLTSALDGGE